MMKYTIKAVNMISKQIHKMPKEEQKSERINLITAFTPSDRDKLEDLIIHLFLKNVK